MSAVLSTEDGVYDQLDPDTLENGINLLVAQYQRTRSEMLAWFVVRYAQALSRHPEFEGSDEERCQLCRLSRQWQLLAIGSASKAAAGDAE